MVKILSWGKDVEGLFGDDIHIVSILLWKGDVIFLGCNTEFSREGGFLDMFFVEHDTLLDPVNPGILLS